MKKLTTLALVLSLAFILLACSPGDTYRTVVISTITGAVSVERDGRPSNASEGMRLNNLDTVKTNNASAARLKLDADKSVELKELTALRIDLLASGFALTLLEGEVETRIDKPLGNGESFHIYAGNIVMGVRGTVFTANYDPVTDILVVSVDSGTVTIADRATGEELAVLNAGQSWQYDAGGVATAGESQREETPTPLPIDLDNEDNDNDDNESSNPTLYDNGKIESFTITGTIINNMEVYNDQYFAYYNQYGSVGIRSFGIRFSQPIILSSGEAVTEAEFRYDRIGNEELQSISATGEITTNDNLVGTTITLTGFLREIPDFVEFGEADAQYTINYFFSPNGRFEFVLE
jgi:hypothetical protein